MAFQSLKHRTDLQHQASKIHGTRPSGRSVGQRGQVGATGSLAVASAVANVAGKGLAARDRPGVPVPVARRLPRPPRTTSFPFGHAASAAAFATGVALEKPGLAVPVAVLAAAVGASRVVTATNYPSDVLAGFAVGAAAGVATLRWWPRRPTAPAAAVRPPRQAPASPDGEGLVLVINGSAGTVSPRLGARLRAELPRAEIIQPNAADDLAFELRRAAGTARILGWRAATAPSAPPAPWPLRRACRCW